MAFEDLGVRELKNIEHPIRLYRVIMPAGPAGARAQAPEHAEPPGAPLQGVRGTTWADALLHPSAIVPLLVGAYLLATRAGLPPVGRLFPAFGAVLVGVGLGRALRLRTGRHAFFLMALGAGLVLASVAGDWCGGTPRWLVIGGIVVMGVGLTQLRPRGACAGHGRRLSE